MPEGEDSVTIVYCIIGYNHDGQLFKGVFSTFEKAREQADILQKDDDEYLNWNSYMVEEYELDKDVLI